MKIFNLSTNLKILKKKQTHPFNFFCKLKNKFDKHKKTSNRSTGFKKCKKKNKKPQITEKIHQWILSLKWSNDYLKTSSVLFLVKNPMGTFGEHFKFLEILRRDGIFKAKDNFWIKFWEFWFFKKRKKKQLANIP